MRSAPSALEPMVTPQRAASLGVLAFRSIDIDDTSSPALVRSSGEFSTRRSLLAARNGGGFLFSSFAFLFSYSISPRGSGRIGPAPEIRIWHV